MKTLKLNKKTLGILLDHQMRSVRGGGQVNTTNDPGETDTTDTTTGGDTGCATQGDTEHVTSATTTAQSNPPNTCLKNFTRNITG